MTHSAGIAPLLENVMPRQTTSVYSAQLPAVSIHSELVNLSQMKKMILKSVRCHMILEDVIGKSSDIITIR
jgi:hypothetical protein